MSVACYVCACVDTAVRTRKNGFIVYRCRRCKLSWALTEAERQPVSEERLREFYGEEYYNSETIIGYKSYVENELIHRVNARGILDAVARHQGLARARVLDVGCAHGYLLDEARRRGAQVYGAEISDSARESAIQNLGLTVAARFPSRELPDGSFDIVFLIGTVEHLADPRSLLADVRRALKPGGLFVLTTLDTQSWLPLYAIKPPEHLFYFNRGNLSRLLEQAGLQPISRTTHVVSYLVHDLLHRLGEFFRISALKTLSSWVRGKAPEAAVRIPNNEMLLLARKR
jgi:2-polyprenyl-3-methyl-5-hydroxy-6-metoxy-1,4-benzoquinol methylase